MLNKLKFSIDIKAEQSAIWKALWDDNCYRDWAGVFYKGSHYVGDDWNEGARILFLAPDKSGVYSIIEKHIPDQVIQFKHIGKVVNGEAQPVDEETRKWSGTTESYLLKAGPDAVTLTIEIDVLDEHLELMTTKFPEALEKIRRNCG